MKDFLDKHQDKIAGTLSCFDRIIFRGHLQLGYPDAMESFLAAHGVLIKDFKTFGPEQAERLKAHAQATAAKLGRPFHYLDRPERKEDRAASLARRDHITAGLICVFSCVEPCQTFKVVPGKHRPRLQSARRKCLFLYYYFLHPVLGLIHVRIQTWLPFSIQVYANGHEWLARLLDRHGIAYQRADNAFRSIADFDRAQRLADLLPSEHWRAIFDRLACKVNPLLADLLEGMSYYWVIDQAEYATDVVFKTPEALQGLYRRLLRHAVLCFSAEDVLTFLGRRLHKGFAGEVLNDFKRRWPGARVKHRMKQNWLKMYDKHGQILRIETVINSPYEFRIRRVGKRQGQRVLGWYPMAKGLANFHRYAEVSGSANGRYLNALAVVDDPAAAHRLLHRISEPVTANGRSVRGFNPAAKADVEVFTAIMQGDHAIMGFRNRDVCQALNLLTGNRARNRRVSARVSRLLKRLHLHGLIAKIPRSRRWRVTKAGHAYMSFSITLREEHFVRELMDIAA
jgi:hypothetical protein